MGILKFISNISLLLILLGLVALPAGFVLRLKPSAGKQVLGVQTDAVQTGYRRTIFADPSQVWIKTLMENEGQFSDLVTYQSKTSGTSNFRLYQVQNNTGHQMEFSIRTPKQILSFDQQQKIFLSNCFSNQICRPIILYNNLDQQPVKDHAIIILKLGESMTWSLITEGLKQGTNTSFELTVEVK